MARFDDLRKRYGAASAEQKLLALRRELLCPIITVESLAHLLQTASDRICDCLPEEVSAEEFKNNMGLNNTLLSEPEAGTL